MLFRNGTRVVALWLTYNITAHGLGPGSNRCDYSLGIPLKKRLSTRTAHIKKYTYGIEEKTVFFISS